MDVIRGHAKDMPFKCGASHIVQAVVKYGEQRKRDKVVVKLKLKGKYKDPAQNKYLTVRFL